MLLPQSKIRVVDNSGAKFIKIIRIIKKGPGIQKGFAGDLSLASVKKLRNKNKLLAKVHKGELVYALIVKTRNEIVRKSGVTIRFYQNAALLLTKAGAPVGTRVFSPLVRELRKKKFMKFFSLSVGSF